MVQPEIQIMLYSCLIKGVTAAPLCCGLIAVKPKSRPLQSQLFCFLLLWCVPSFHIMQMTLTYSNCMLKFLVSELRCLIKKRWCQYQSLTFWRVNNLSCYLMPQSNPPFTTILSSPEAHSARKSPVR